MIIDAIQPSFTQLIQQLLKTAPKDIANKITANVSVSPANGAIASTGVGGSWVATSHNALIYLAVQIANSYPEFQVYLSTVGIPAKGAAPNSGDTLIFKWDTTGSPQNLGEVLTVATQPNTTYYIYLAFYNSQGVSSTWTVNATTPTGLSPPFAVPLYGAPCIYVWGIEDNY